MWWQHDALEQWLHDFLSDALRRRGINALLSDPVSHPFELLSDPRQYGFTSLDMMQLASRYAACLGLDKTGLSDLLLARRSAKGWCDVARRSRQINDQHMGFYSSGSTANPKLCHHQMAKLQAEAEFFARHLPACQRVICTVPSHHIYGFIWGILLPAELSATNNVPGVFINSSRSLPASWVTTLKDGDMIVATPDSWQLLMELNLQLPDHFVGISSTAALPAETAAFFRARYSQATLVEIYGSTETAGLAWRTDYRAGFRLLPWWQLTLTQQQASVESSISEDRHLLNDRLQRDTDGNLQVLGRCDNVIQMAGHNINLDTLAEKLCAHPDVTAAKVQHDSQGDGQRLHYFLALTQAPDSLTDWCQNFSRWLQHQLGDVPTPASVVVATALPRDLNNKTVTWEPGRFPAVTGVYRSLLPHAAADRGIDKSRDLG